MKKLLSIILVLSMCAGLSLTALASEENDTITIEEYMAALQEEAAKYGMEVELLEYHPDKVITREALEHELEVLRRSAESLEVTPLSEGLEIFEVVEKSPNTGEDFTDANVMRIMPINKR